MRLLTFVSAPALSIALFSGCSSSSGSNTSQGNVTTASFHMEQSIGAGEEAFKCQYVTLPNVKAFMTKGEHQYTPGSHHILVYTTDLTSVPKGMDQVQDCYEGASNDIMAHATGILYGGQDPQGTETLPAGVGVPTTPNQVLILQTHYLNSTAKALSANVDVHLSLDTGSDIKTNAGVLFFYDPFIDVPAGAKAKASMRCPIPKDITLVYATSHYHARGNDYAAYVDESADHLATTPFYTSASWSSPPNAQLEMKIKAGSLIRFQCGYDNTAGTTPFFQGQSAKTNEMCVFSGMYYPEISHAADYCQSGADFFGNGTADCKETLSCIQSCGASPSGMRGGGASQCEQTCMVDSCPTATTSLMPLLDCMQGTCASQCADMASPGCKSCMQSSCAAAASACQSHSCQ